MSWLWGNETTEQAQIVVSALQGELDERELKIQALEAALRREQHDFQQLLQSEIRELEAKRARIAHELRDVDALIADKQALLQNGKSDGAKKTPVKKKKTKAEAAAPGAPGATTASTALEKKPSEKKKTKKKPQTTSAAAASTKPQALPMDDHVLKVAKVEPNVAFIIQRSTVRICSVSPFLHFSFSLFLCFSVSPFLLFTISNVTTLIPHPPERQHGRVRRTAKRPNAGRPQASGRVLAHV